MAKSTRKKYLVKSIRKNFISFLNVALIAAVGMSVLIGILSASTSIMQQANTYYIENKLQTLEIKSALGITEEDIALLSQQESVDIAEGGYTTKVLTEVDKEKLILQAMSLGKNLNLTTVVEGILPTAVDEVAIEQKFADKRGVKIGDVLTLEHEGSLYADEFTVTAIVNQPMYCCVMGKETRGTSTIGMGVVSFYVMLAPEAFRTEYFYNRFTVARIRNNEMDSLYYYSEAYREQEELMVETMETLGEEHGKSWVVSDRENAGDLRGIVILDDTLRSMSYSLALLFILVVVVVCFTAISRMIEEQRSLIGMQRAQGFRAGEILRHYMTYNVLCAVTGIIMGWLLSVFGIEKIILMMLNPKFLVGKCGLVFVWKEGLIVGALYLAIFALTTYLTCRKIVRRPAVQLMNSGRYGEQNQAFFFEQWSWYKKCSLYVRAMIKNVLGDKKRLFTTIIGVLGSVTLMVLSFSLRLAISGAFERQFEDYYFFENRMTVESEKASLDEYKEILEKEGISYINIQDKLKNYRIDGGRWTSAHILALDNVENLDDFMYLEDVETGQKITLPEDGILVSRKCAEIEGLSEGSIVEILDETGEIREFRVAGIMEHYISFTYFVTSTSYYEEVMGEPADACVFLLKGDVSGLYEKVKDMDGFMSLKDNSDFKEDASIVYIVIGICIVLAACMVFLVVLNQVTMYIDRKAMELAIMRINGYKIKETKAFIYRDSVALTIIGLIFGSGFGMALAYLMIMIMEREIHHYVRTPNILACVYAGAITVVFVVIVNIIGLRKIHKLNMTNVSAN